MNNEIESSITFRLGSYTNMPDASLSQKEENVKLKQGTTFEEKDLVC